MIDRRTAVARPAAPRGPLERPRGRAAADSLKALVPRRIITPARRRGPVTVARPARTREHTPRRTVVNIHLHQWGTGPRLRVAKPSSRPAGAPLPVIHHKATTPRQQTKPGRAPTFYVVAVDSIRQFAASSCPGPVSYGVSCPLRRGASPSAGRRPASDRTRRRPPPAPMKPLSGCRRPGPSRAAGTARRRAPHLKQPGPRA